MIHPNEFAGTTEAMEAVIVQFGALVSAMDENVTEAVLVASDALSDAVFALKQTLTMKEETNEH